MKYGRRDYPPRIPRDLPDDQVLVHNHIRPARRQGTRGFRFWLQSPTAQPPVEQCDCGWAVELAEHYRVVGAGALPTYTFAGS